MSAIALFAFTVPCNVANADAISVAAAEEAVGVAGWAGIMTADEATEAHPSVVVTVKLYVPASRFTTVKLAPVPAIDPGLIVQLPEGKPINITLPVATVQVGGVIVPTIGAAGKSLTVTTVAADGAL